MSVAGCAVSTANSQGISDLDRPPEDEVIYFVMPDRFENGDPSNDRGGLEGGPLETGFDPTHKGFYHGGDLAGLTARLGYIQGLGATAIWLTPIFENKPVQGPPGLESSGYHGYWITDFTNVDPHLGTREEFRAFVEAAHARGMKVYMDIITNHTADVIKYAECHGPDALADYREQGICPYRSLGDYPFTTVGDANGTPINHGFLGLGAGDLTGENFARLTRPDYAYTPYVPREERDAKTPAWLNDPIHYHNRGDTRFEGENSRLGDFAGLDDLMTESPVVVDGMIEIYKQWITDYRVDGFRIDTARHVNPEFWQQFIPAIETHARAEGIDHFHIFGEVYEFDPGQLAVFTTRDQLPTVLDFAFQGRVRGLLVDGAPARELERLFEVDAVYAGGEATARRLPTFLGNHDMGRFAGMLAEAHPEMAAEEQLARVRLAHAVMMFSRGVPTIYYGDEQGFVSDGGDQAAREDMFASEVASYNDNALLGTDATTAERNFDSQHPLYRAIAELAAIRSAHTALRQGPQAVRHSDLEGGLIVLSRFAPDRNSEYVIAFNADLTERQVNIPVDGRARDWVSAHGVCQPTSPTPGAYSLTVPALDFLVCHAEFVEPVE
ncbi:MAG: alpha-amylase family glycosyl hydrolase [Hyphomonadaceae bacterium]|nr:alpha-amylase family glycosyl hydrolase [Hyphomonadaceae bacterium]